MKCRIGGCDLEVNARGMCVMHYKRWYRSTERTEKDFNHRWYQTKPKSKGST